MYSKKVKDHFMNPRNMGEMEDPDGIGLVGNPVCGDVMKIFIRVEDGRITDIKFQTFGCAAAIATSSMITELAMNKTIEEAMKITRDDVAKELDGLPKVKMHCSNLAADGLRAAIEDWEKRMSGDVPEDSTEGTKANPCDSCAQLHEGECETRN
ncbi:MAG: Fe-S cluster assembly scaffold protein NifU [Thermoplasmata archaeon]|nr:Fe-S cluster assembly scaffold protein NifU [Thermoplasmata archaeon]